MPAADMTLEQVTTEVARSLNIVKMMDTPEGRAFVASAINVEMEKVRAKFDSEVADERKLRTAAEEASAELIRKFEKLERRSVYDRDFGIHRGIDGKLHANVSREAAEKIGRLVLACRGKNPDAEAIRAVSTGVGAEGGYLLQEDVATEVLRLIPEYGLYPKIARPFPMPTQKVQVGTVLTGMNAYWIGENTGITESFPGFDKVTLEAKQLGAYIPIPLALIEDSVVDFGQLVADLIRECIGKEIDRVALVGKSASNSGTDPFDGLLYSPGVNLVSLPDGQTSMKGFTADTLSDAQDAIPEGADEDNTYIFHKKTFSYLRKQKDKDGQPVFQRPTDGEPGTIFDIAYYKSYRMPTFSTATAPSTRFALCGDWKRWALFGMRKELAIATSDVAGDTFKNAQIAVRGLTRVAIASFGPAFTAIQTAAS